MLNREQLIANTRKLIQGMQVLDIPILVTEQYPKGLGPTVSEIAELLTGIVTIPKLSFSCCGEKNFLEKLKLLQRKNILVSGIEGHVCVYQTAVDLIDSGYAVYVVTDAVSSRTSDNRDIGFTLMSRYGASLTSTETVLFELLKKAGGEQFKAISRIVK